MAASVPIVATAVGGIPEIVEDGATAVLLEPPPDARRLAAAVARLLDDRGARTTLAEAGRARFLAGFDAASWAGRTRAVYDSVLNGG
jgi:glycosyltransferase involved in cell wall biosynthesis